MDKLPNELIWTIFDLLDLHSQINFRMVCKKFKEFDVSNFWDTGTILRSDKIKLDLLQKYPHITRLNLHDNRYITDINFLSNLQTVNIGGFCRLDMNGIENLDKLVSIYASCNKKITSVDKFKYLKKIIR